MVRPVIHNAAEFARQVRADLQSRYPEGEWSGDAFVIPAPEEPSNEPVVDPTASNLPDKPSDVHQPVRP